MNKIELINSELEGAKELLEKTPGNIELAKEVERLKLEVEAEEQREGILERRKEELETLENMNATKRFLLSNEEKNGLPIRIEYLKKEIEKLEKARKIL